MTRISALSRTSPRFVPPHLALFFALRPSEAASFHLCSVHNFKVAIINICALAEASHDSRSLTVMKPQITIAQLFSSPQPYGGLVTHCFDSKPHLCTHLLSLSC